MRGSSSCSSSRTRSWTPPTPGSSRGRRRIAVSAAGPVSDLVLGGAFSLVCLALPAGSVRDVVFQLAFGAYLGALLNLNPLLDRDGYHILVDVLREPGLRTRALAQLRLRLAGRGRGDGLAAARPLRPPRPRVDRRRGAACAAAFSLRYDGPLAAVLPGSTSWALLAVVWLAAAAPAAGDRGAAAASSAGTRRGLR